ncbi:hypothetical protein MNEG_0372 [Monoraphidium neglectum]|uniref:Uncharacterized protein n=1 Tax=Monoraphidium neglectum TaxID=145388 RepID=A0A0D2MYP6_9CHLO|nr:hypothetical protein MNEG_0372 [Monoraphidium neglectum]KIZ07580.1 hypothetical protein MNEG_0372 [Monoraphidium neglectum]|eukprot:XP_013906599.1 hypothetical protein MNEG_0372 [Monoraphidium neglectum]
MAGPVVLITGCTEGGIGHALCCYLHGRGCRVFATARRPEAAAGLEERGIPVLKLDVQRPESCQQAVEDVIEAAGRLDILVNNAGVVTLGPTCEVPIDTARTIFDTNVFGLLQMCQAVHRQMVAQGSGKIVNIGSLTGLQPVPLRGVYSATKAAVQRLSGALRIELGPFGVQVMLVSPGFIDTKARETAKSNAALTTGGLWGGWLAVLERVMAKRLSKAVPVDTYAAQLGSVILQKHLPRHW